ncbi:MAG: hypothetical protein ACF8SC_02045 [Phycisphaerales bacterium JB037]
MSHDHTKPKTPDHLELEHEEPDAWHRHTLEEGIPQPEHAAHVSPKGLWGAFFGMAIFLVVTIAALIVYFDHHMTNLRQERVETTVQAERFGLKYKEESRTGLDAYRWINRDAGTVQIPIEVAMDRVVERYAAEPDTGG